MKHLLKLIKLLLVLSCANCNFHPAKGDYEYSLKQLGQELSEHFPNSNELKSFGVTTNFIYGDNSTLDETTFDTQSLMVYGKTDKDEFERIMLSAKNKSIMKYNSNDTSLLTLIPYSDRTFVDGKWYKNLETPKKRRIAEKNSKRLGKIPIPYFTLDKYQNSSSLCNLSDDYEIFIIKAISGRNQFSITYDCEYLPNEWQHGMMCGYALNNKTENVIYWATVW
ncbi:hypothetical protein DF185_06580 [Marinifilum breve]|uniref:Uncharacterized protein n=1 Tax=Marinifilum breve TaxID=2184082 RepID=A0A2V4A0X1_9BACT|nr:hypothetical protein [Marinifilum breve]PXY02308.1 hypothetical protein DF185_06580 [Marinifilum breve]